MNLTDKLKKVHNDRYDYSLVTQANGKDKIKIICSEHGVFEQRLDSHLSGNGCPKCGISKRNKPINEFINEAKLIHNDKYDYSLSNYIGSKSKVKIMCPKHGVFEQTPDNHLQGNGCPKCSGKNKTNNEFISEARLIHGDKYDYSLSNYIGSKSKVKIICSKHGVFEQTPDNHLQGNGCHKCGNFNLTTNDFILKSNKIHNGRYDYSLVNYINTNKKVKIICPKHGVFEQDPSGHLQGNGCRKCSGRDKTIENVINSFKTIHGNKYDYSTSKYIDSQTKVNIICPKHGEFFTLVSNHLKGCLCPKCSFLTTKPQSEVISFIKSLSIDIEINNRTILNGKELDIFIPSKNIAIEYNGLYWHSEEFKDKNYHLNKTNLCEQQGIQLIHIFEDEWLHKQDIVKSRLKNILGLTQNRIFGRKTEIREVSSRDSRLFLDMNHIQGNVNGSIRLGLYYEDELVSLMAFGSLRKSMGSKSSDSTYELLRFCNKLDTTVIGGADKLLKHFVKIYKPKETVSYADIRWSMGNLYEKLGFVKIHSSAPNYYYIINGKREYRFKYRKDVLVKQGFDMNKSEHEIMLDRKIYRIYDCGNIKYKLTQ